MRDKLTLPAMLLAGAAFFTAAPDTQIAAAECGGPGTVICKENEACVGILFFRQCTTTYDYWSSGAPDGPDGPGDPGGPGGDGPLH